MKVFGVSGRTYEIGEAVAGALNPKEGDYTPVPMGFIVREATEDEWFDSRPGIREAIADYPDPSVFTFEHYYLYE